MEALQSLRVAAAAASPSQCCSSQGRAIGSTDGFQNVRAVAGAKESYRGVSLQSQRTIVAAKRRSGRGGAVVTIFAVIAEDLDLSDLVQARRDVQAKEVETRGFSIVEVETTAAHDWHPATVVQVEQVAAGVRCITLTTECSRELVKLKNAYRQPGQLAQVNVNDKVSKVPASSPPFSQAINDPVLYKIRGDIPAGLTKLPAFSLSATAPVDLHVTEADSPTVYNLKEGNEVQLGPWEPSGVDLRPILFLSRYPTILLFAHGRGIAVARSLLEAKDADTGSLNFGHRENVRLFYSARKPSLLAYKGLYSKWEETRSVKVRTIVDSSSGEDWDGLRGSLTKLWDEDDIEYDPRSTGVVVAVERIKRKEMKMLLAESGIPEDQVVYWDL